MTWLDHLREGVSSFIAAVVAAMVGLIGWLIRTVFTNQKKIELLEQALAHRDSQRDDMRSDIAEVKADVKNIQALLMERK